MSEKFKETRVRAGQGNEILTGLYPLIVVQDDVSLKENERINSGWVCCQRFSTLVGTFAASGEGTALILFSITGEGDNVDALGEIVEIDTKLKCKGFSAEVLAPYFKVSYTNGPNKGQTALRGAVYGRSVS